MKARSELVAPSKPSGAGVVETSLMFQAASPASRSPALRPMRGSGLGGFIDMERGAAATDVDEDAHAAAYTAAPSSAGSSAQRAGAPKNDAGFTFSDLRVGGTTGWWASSGPSG